MQLSPPQPPPLRPASPPAAAAASPIQLPSNGEFRHPGIGSAASAPATFYPPVLPYRERQPIPYGYRLEQSSNTPLAIGGAVTFLVSYGAGLVLAATDGFDNGAGWMVAPIVGPWVAIATRDNPCRSVQLGTTKVVELSCINNALEEAFMIVIFTVDGLVQATGAALFVIGVASKHRELVRNDVAGFRVAPRRFGSTGYGLQATASF